MPGRSYHAHPWREMAGPAPPVTTTRSVGQWMLMRGAAYGAQGPGSMLPGRRHAGITVVITGMTIAQSKLTSQGQVSIPAEVRRRLGLGPGSVIEWDQDGERIVVRRAGRYSSAEVSAALFPSGTGAPRSLKELKAGLRANVKRRHARH